MQGHITKTSVEALQPGEMLIDDKVRGFVARCLPSGAVSYGLRFRVRGNGKRRWVGIGVHGAITADQARLEAERLRGAVADRRDPVAERKVERVRATGAHTVNHVLDEHMRRYVRANGLRSADEIERCFDRYVRPRIGTRSIYELKRSDIRGVLDRVDGHGEAPVMADRVLAHLRKALNWWAAQDDEFNSPIVKGMARTSPTKRARKRTLDDQELRDLWKALDAADVPACYPALVRFILMSARRRSEPARMRWPEIEGDVWIIPVQRHKTGDEAGELAMPLTRQLSALLGKPKRKGFVFSTTHGRKAFDGWSKSKKAIDEAIAELRKAEGRPPMPHWTLHDLRRTARSLMSRAGVDGDVAERVLGHKVAGVRGVYDRYEYLEEKRGALERLAVMLVTILNPPRPVA